MVSQAESKPPRTGSVRDKLCSRLQKQMKQSGERFDTAFQLSKDIVMGKFKPRIHSDNGEFDLIAERRRQEEIEAQLVAAMHRK